MKHSFFNDAYCTYLQIILFRNDVLQSTRMSEMPVKCYDDNELLPWKSYWVSCILLWCEFLNLDVFKHLQRHILISHFICSNSDGCGSQPEHGPGARFVPQRLPLERSVLDVPPTKAAVRKGAWGLSYRGRYRKEQNSIHIGRNNSSL